MRGLGLLLGVLLVAKAASACEPSLEPPEKPLLVKGEQCSAQYKRGPGGYLSEAEDLGGGFVLQSMGVVDICGWTEIDYLVQDCNSGRVAIFGGTYDPIGENDEYVGPDGYVQRTDLESFALEGKVREAAARGEHMSVDEVLSAAGSMKVQFQLEAKTKSIVAINKSKFTLGCGCKLFYGG